MRLLSIWLINALSLLAVAYLLPSVIVESFSVAVITALLLAVVNTVIRPVLVLLTLPIGILTLGLFTLVINALLFWSVASFVEGFRVAGFWSALWGALLYSLISTLASGLLVPRAHPVERSWRLEFRVPPEREGNPRQRRDHDGGWNQ